MKEGFWYALFLPAVSSLRLLHRRRKREWGRGKFERKEERRTSGRRSDRRQKTKKKSWKNNKPKLDEMECTVSVHHGEMPLYETTRVALATFTTRDCLRRTFFLSFTRTCKKKEKERKYVLHLMRCILLLWFSFLTYVAGSFFLSPCVWHAYLTVKVFLSLRRPEYPVKVRCRGTTEWGKYKEIYRRHSYIFIDRLFISTSALVGKNRDWLTDWLAFSAVHTPGIHRGLSLPWIGMELLSFSWESYPTLMKYVHTTARP